MYEFIAMAVRLGNFLLGHRINLFNAMHGFGSGTHQRANHNVKFDIMLHRPCNINNNLHSRLSLLLINFASSLNARGKPH